MERLLEFHASCRANGRIARHISITKSGKLHTCRPYATQISRHFAIYFLLRQVTIVLIRTFFLIEDIQTVLSPKGRLKEGTANKGLTWHAFSRKDGVCDWEESETCVPNISHSYKPAQPTHTPLIRTLTLHALS